MTQPATTVHAANGRRPRAAALLSGGLDSMLAAKVVLDQGVDVRGVNFFTGFCVEGAHPRDSTQRSRQGQAQQRAVGRPSN